MKDIFAHLGTRDFWRLRIGIGHPGERADVVNYVLDAPRREEAELIEHAMQRALNVFCYLEALCLLAVAAANNR